MARIDRVECKWETISHMFMWISVIQTLFPHKNLPRAVSRSRAVGLTFFVDSNAVGEARIRGRGPMTI
jgi:hypothetical protein